MNAVMNPMELPLVGIDDSLRVSMDQLGLLVPAAFLEGVGHELESLKDEAVEARSQHERRWLDDLRQYHGIPFNNPETKDRPQERGDYRATRDNITRPKVRLAASRLGDMLFPTTDRNWSLEPTPMKEMEGATEGEMSQELKDEISARCRAMQEQIDDQLSESNYSGHGRRAIDDAALYGTGVIKGPFAQTKRRFRTDQGTIVEENKSKPTVTWVDLWNFFPQPARKIEEAEHVFELHVMTKKQVRQLQRAVGFSKTQVARLLSLPPMHGGVNANSLGDRVAVDGIGSMASKALHDRYTVWEFNGPMPADALRAFLVMAMKDKGIPEEIGAQLMLDLEAEASPQVDCCVWFCQGLVLKMALHPYPCDQLYHVFNYEPDQEDLFGYGIPYIMRDDQKARDQTWQAIMLNSQMSSAPQIGVLKDVLERVGPAQGKMDLTCTRPRTWAFSGEVTDIRNAITVQLVPNVVGQLLPVLDKIEQNADSHTLMPIIAQGEPTAKVPTASGLAMLMNASNIVQRRLAKAYDDDVTGPLITGFYHYNMVNGIEAAKGEFEVVPRGVSHLLVKDVQVNNFMVAMQLYMGNPALAPYIMPKLGKWATRGLQLLDMEADELLASEEEAAAYQEQQAQSQQAPDPRAEAAMMTAQVRDKEVTARIQNFERDDDFRAQDRQLDHQEFLIEMQARKEIEALKAQARESELMLALAKMDREDRLALEKLMDAQRARAEETSRYQWGKGFDGALKAQETQTRQRELEAQIAHETPLRI